MRVPVSRDRSWFVPVRPLAALGGVLLAAAVTISVALAAPSTKNYSVVITPPTSLTPLVPAAVGFKLANAGDSTQTLGSANITVPAEFTVSPSPLSVTPPEGKSWTATYSPSSLAIELRAVSSRDAIAPGQSITATMTVTASCSATTRRWDTEAKQANSFSGSPGNNFNPVGGDPIVTVISSGGTATKLRFVQQPGRTQVSTNMTPAVTVEALDACDNPAVATGNVALTLNPHPSGAAVSGALQAFDDGLATFSVLRITKAGEGYQLEASAGDLSPATSEPFDVVTRLCTSTDANPVCQASDVGGTVTVLTARPSGNATMTLDFAGGPICTGYTTRGAVARIEPEDYAGTGGIEITMRWSKSVAPGTGVSNFVLCMSKDGTNYSVPRSCAKGGNLPNGESFCELKRSRSGVGELVISFLIHPQDPYVGLG